jgi:ABC-type transport system involved in multi-copper enzyme maturation permease subunit
MKNLASVIYVEFLKSGKSKILLVTTIIFMIVPCMMGLMMFVARNPELAGKLGMIGTKAKLFGENDWKGYFALLNQVLASIGLIGFGFVTSWVFGREHTERTIKDLLALPVARQTIVMAKFVIVFIWCIFLAGILYAVTILFGLLIHLPGWSTLLFTDFSNHFLITALLTLLLCSPISYLAGVGTGIVAPLGFVLITMIMAQFVGLIGLGPYFPWAIPGLFSVSNDTPGLHIRSESYIILALTFLAGYWATVRWWQYADHH